MAKLTQIFHEPGALINDFVVDWSKDNKVAVATQNGVCIYEVKCKPNEKELTAAGVFAKIMPEKEQHLCFGKDLPFMGICREKVHNITDMFTDTGIMAITTQNEAFTGYRQALWSPPGMAPHDSCLLATLSWDRRLKIYQVQSAKPSLMIDISCQWIQQHAKLPDAVSDLADVKKRTYELSIIDMVWTEMSEPRDGPARCHLVTVTRSGHVAIWRITAGVSSATLVADWLLSDPEDRVSCLKWIEGCGTLLFGRQSGRLQGYGLKLTDQISTGAPCKLLDDQDQLPISCIVTADDSRSPPLLLAKGFAVMALRLDWDGDLTRVTSSTFVRLEGAQVTGTAIVSTLYNQFWMVTLTSEAELALSTAPIAVLLQPLHYSCHALATSPNRVVICTVERVFDYYDHLVLREPVRVSFTLLEKPLDELINSALNSSDPLHRLTDVLEAARLTMLVDKTPFSLVEDDESLARKSARHLQCTLFMVSSSLPLDLPHADNKPHLASISLDDNYVTPLSVGHLDAWGGRGGAGAPTDAPYMLFYRRCDGDAASPPQSRHEQLPASLWLEVGYAEKVRGHLLRAHFRRVLQRSGHGVDGPFQKRAKALLNADTVDLSQLTGVMPCCQVCQQSLSELTSLEARCRAGHRLPVCCQTLALCHTVPYRRCHQCGAFAVSSTELVTGLELGPWCTFCDGRLVTPH